MPRHVVEEYIQRHPEVKSQAGREKAEGVVGRVVQEFEKSETRGRPRKGEERRETYWEKRCRPI